MSNDQRGDAKIARRVLAGDKEAFGYFVDKYSDLVFRVVIKHVYSRIDALDIVQEVFVKAYRALSKVKDYSTFRHWLTRIAVNKSLNWRRMKRNNAMAMFSEVSDSAIENSKPHMAGNANARPTEHETMLRVVNSLPPKWHQIVILKYLDNMSYDRIAGELNLSIATVRTRLARAKQMMKNMLAKESGVPTENQQVQA